MYFSIILLVIDAGLYEKRLLSLMKFCIHLHIVKSMKLDMARIKLHIISVVEQIWRYLTTFKTHFNDYIGVRNIFEKGRWVIEKDRWLHNCATDADKALIRSCHNERRLILGASQS